MLHEFDCFACCMFECLCKVYVVNLFVGLRLFSLWFVTGGVLLDVSYVGFLDAYEIYYYIVLDFYLWFSWFFRLMPGSILVVIRCLFRLCKLLGFYLNDVNYWFDVNWLELVVVLLGMLQFRSDKCDCLDACGFVWIFRGFTVLRLVYRYTLIMDLQIMYFDLLWMDRCRCSIWLVL
eukprot:gene3539-2490_t